MKKIPTAERPAHKSLVVLKDSFTHAPPSCSSTASYWPPSRSPTRSMEDTVKAGDRLFVNKLIYGGTTPYTIPFASIRIRIFECPDSEASNAGM